MGGIEVRDVTGNKLTETDLEFTSKRVTKGERVGRFIADTKLAKLYAIPANVDHPDFVAALLGKSVTDLKKAPFDCNYFVAVSIILLKGHISLLLIGVSGFEMVMKNPAKKERA